MIPLAGIQSDTEFLILEEPREVSPRYCCIDRNEKVPPYYLFAYLSSIKDKFLARYKQTINLPFEAVLNLKVPIADKELMETKAKVFKFYFSLEQQEEKIIEELKNAKKSLLSGMMI